MLTMAYLRLIILTSLVSAPVLATTTQADYRKVVIASSVWRSSQPKEVWSETTVVTCGILCMNLATASNSCQAFNFNKETKRCVTASNITLGYPSEKGVPVYARLLEDGTVPFSGGDICHIDSLPSVDGSVLTAWSPDCSQQCGLVTLTRTCSPPRHGGLACQGGLTNSSLCLSTCKGELP